MPGAALVVPLMEELFWRSFVMRRVDAADAESLGPACVGLKGFLVSVLLFGFAPCLPAPRWKMPPGRKLRTGFTHERYEYALLRRRWSNRTEKPARRPWPATCGASSRPSAKAAPRAATAA